MEKESQDYKTDYDSGLTVWYMEKTGIEIVHYIISGGIVYYATSATNQLFTTDGSTFLLPSEMREKVQADIKSFTDDGINDIEKYFDEYYSLTHCGVTRNLAVADYNRILNLLNATFMNLRKAIFY